MSINPRINRKQALGFWNPRRRVFLFSVFFLSWDAALAISRVSQVVVMTQTLNGCLYRLWVPHSIISSAEILTPQLGTDARYQIEGGGEVLRSYSNNIDSKKLFLVRFLWELRTVKQKSEKNVLITAPGGKIDLKAIEGIRYGDHYWVIGCCVKTGRKMAPCYFKTKLIAVNDAGRH